LKDAMSAASSEPVGTLEVALAHATRLLTTRPEVAAEQAAEILKVVPNHPAALLIQGAAARATGQPARAAEILTAITRTQPQWSLAFYELGVALFHAGRSDEALQALREAVRLKPEFTQGWLALGDALTSTGDNAGADEAYAWHIKTSIRDPRLVAAGAALVENNIPEAEALLRAHLKQFPNDVAALRMLAEVAARLRRFKDAESLLVRCLELAPSFTGARHNYAVVLHRQNRPVEALAQVAKLLGEEPHHPGYNNLKAAILVRIGDYQQSIEIYEQVLAAYPELSKIWMSYGHALKTKGRESDSITAYRKSIGLEPTLGEAYWSLANLKTFRFSAADLAAMRAQQSRADLAEEDRYHLHFALGKALEDAHAYAESFEEYAQGNRLRKQSIRYFADELTEHVRRSKTLFTRQFFADRRGYGAPSAEPIFIVGLPRAGSTLLEQILSSHSQVEGTMELPDIPAITKKLSGVSSRSPSKYWEAIASLSADDCRALGEEYLARTRIQRKSGAPRFIDKMPNNFTHLALMHLILPNATIIDARRHPLACCFSGFKQHFARGQHFSYDLTDIGRYYHDYVELMAHFDAVLPGRIHRVVYESMVADTEHEVRTVLAHCGLEFEESCLRFYENERAVRTASSQQVRQPIFREAVDHWRHFDPWLLPLKQALGPVLDVYPDPPEF
jgi:tetratricopeptide (TPR) repeat protein